MLLSDRLLRKVSKKLLVPAVSGCSSSNWKHWTKLSPSTYCSPQKSAASSLLRSARGDPPGQESESPGQQPLALGGGVQQDTAETAKHVVGSKLLHLFFTTEGVRSADTQATAAGDNDVCPICIWLSKACKCRTHPDLEFTEWQAIIASSSLIVACLCAEAKLSAHNACIMLASWCTGCCPLGQPLGSMYLAAHHIILVGICHLTLIISPHHGPH